MLIQFIDDAVTSIAPKPIKPEEENTLIPGGKMESHLFSFHLGLFASFCSVHVKWKCLALLHKANEVITFQSLNLFQVS